jgi:hypothetical protein
MSVEEEISAIQAEIKRFIGGGVDRRPQRLQKPDSAIIFRSIRKIKRQRMVHNGTNE